MKFNWLAVGLFALAVALAPATAQPTDPIQREAAGLGFAEHRDPRGFVVWKPSDWLVAAPTPSEVSLADPSQQAFVLIRGRVVRGDLADWLARGFPAGDPWLGQFTPLGAEAAGPNAARAAFRIVDAAGNRRRANAVAVRQGEIATVMMAVAPEERFPAYLPGLSLMLDSFRFAAPQGGGPGAGAPDTVIWVDPLENAFSTHLPRGWRPDGGLRRTTSGAARTLFTVASPDGRIALFVGDPNVPRFIIPSPLLESLGYREGQLEPSSGQVISRFRHAGDIGGELVRRRFGQVQLQPPRERPDLVEHRRRNQPVLQGTLTAMTAADIDFQMPDGRMGTMTVINSGWDYPGLTGGWTVDEVYGFIAPREAAATAGAALGQALGMFRVNPQWFQQESRDQRDFQQRYLEYLNQSAALQQQTINHRWAVQDRQGREWRDALTNTVRLIDPQSNETFEVQAGSRYFYRNPNPQRPGIFGVDADFNPDPVELRRLLQMGVDTPYR